MKRIFSFLVLAFSAASAFSQVPDAFNYQAVVRNSSGEILAGETVSFRFSIVQGSETGTVLYEETWQRNTNEQGLVSLVIGKGTPVNGSWTSINWADGPLYLKAEMDPAGGSAWQPMGTGPLQTVPYSLLSEKTLGISGGKLEVSGDESQDPEVALFEVKRSDGQTVFAVYPEGVRVYVEDLPEKGTKGGFAVGGFTPGKGLSNEYLWVTPDSVRVYVEGQAGKASKGGFAVGGFTPGKETATNFLDLTPENYFIGHRSGINLTAGLFNSTLGYESGFSITEGNSNSFIGYQSGFNNTTGSGNLFLGYQTGYSNRFGNYNSFLGYQAGYKNSGGTNNTFLGSFSGHLNEGGSYNTFIGDSTGYKNNFGSYNTFVGTKVGLNNSTGYSNVYIGNDAGFSNDNGMENVMIGRGSGYSNSTGSRNVFMGTASGYSNTSGWDNIFIGTSAGRSLVDGDGNVVIGYEAGLENKTGLRNVFIGNQAGMLETGSNKLYIENSGQDSTTALIWGDFSRRALRFNGTVGINADPKSESLLIYSANGVGSVSLQGGGNGFDYSAIYLRNNELYGNRQYSLSHSTANSFVMAYNNGVGIYPRMIIDNQGNISINTWETGTEILDVNGNARFRGVLSGAGDDLLITADGRLRRSTSDKRMKTGISEIPDALIKVLAMNGRTFIWKDDPAGRRDAGLIAQEVAEVFPEAVFQNPQDGMMGINYSRFPALFVEAFKDQQKIIRKQQEEIDALNERLQQLETMLLKKL